MAVDDPQSYDSGSNFGLSPTWQETREVLVARQSRDSGLGRLGRLGIQVSKVL